MSNEEKKLRDFWILTQRYLPSIVLTTQPGKYAHQYIHVREVGSDWQAKREAMNKVETSSLLASDCPTCSNTATTSSENSQQVLVSDLSAEFPEAEFQKWRLSYLELLEMPEYIARQWYRMGFERGRTIIAWDVVTGPLTDKIADLEAKLAEAEKLIDKLNADVQASMDEELVAIRQARINNGREEALKAEIERLNTRLATWAGEAEGAFNVQQVEINELKAEIERLKLQLDIATAREHIANGEGLSTQEVRKRIKP